MIRLTFSKQGMNKNYISLVQKRLIYFLIASLRRCLKMKFSFPSCYCFLWDTTYFLASK